MSAPVTFLVWVLTFGKLAPQKVGEGVKGAPFLDEGIRRHVVGTPIKLSPERAALGLDDLLKLYPAPPVTEGTYQ